MFLRHPDTLLDLARLEQAERDRRLEQHLHLYTLRQLNSRNSNYSSRSAVIRSRLAHLLQALANRLQPATESLIPPTDNVTRPDTWTAPRSAHVQRLRQRARPHAAAIAGRHDSHRLDAA